MIESDEKYMSLALQLAEKGRGRVSPNPMVGCVIVRGKEIVGTGYHEVFGGPHAEVNAIANVEGGIEDCTVYVTLEPCTHYGKTPPCADLLVKKMPKRVVVATKDANPIVSGNGIAVLENSGIEVTVGVKEKEANELNRIFNLNITEKRPYITAKFALTLDGFIAQSNYESKWISGVESRTEVHKLRSEVDGVLVGSGTARHDDPELNVRLTEGRNPKRIVIASHLKIPLNSKILTGKDATSNTIVFCTNEAQNMKSVEKLKSHGLDIRTVSKTRNSKVSIKNVLSILYKEYRIGHLLLEGGSQMFSAFYDEDYIDEIISFSTSKILGAGISPFANIKARNLSSNNRYYIHSTKKTGDDLMIVYRRR